MEAVDTQAAIDVKQAVQIAHQYLLDIMKSYEQRLPHLLLEEVEFSEKENVWLVTFGFDTGRVIETSEENEYERYLGAKRISTSVERSYKLVRVSSDGKPISMKNKPFI